MPIELWVVAGTLTLFAGIAVPVITRTTRRSSARA